MIYLEPREDLDKAIIGIHSGRVLYDYESLVECYAEHFTKNSQDELSKDQAIEQAIDWVSYNTLGALPSFGENGPMILSPIDNDEHLDEIMEQSLETMMFGGLLWEVLS